MHTLGPRGAEKLALAGIKISLIELRSCELSPETRILPELMNEKSVLILDIRDDTGGIEELSKFFDVEIISQVKITLRVCCKKKS